MTIMTDTTLNNKWQARIEARRTGAHRMGNEVVSYVEELLRDNHVTVDDVAAFLTPDELHTIHEHVENLARKRAENARQAAERHAQHEAAKLVRQQEIEDYYRQNPVLPLTGVEITSESGLFDILAHYHITKVKCSFDAYYNWGEFQNIDGVGVDHVYLSPFDDDEIEIELDELPGDEDGSVGDAIHDYLVDVAHERAADVAAEGCSLEEEGVVIFDVSTRRITASATLEMKIDKLVELTWEPMRTSPTNRSKVIIRGSVTLPFLFIFVL
jgi:hypothetical protein